MGLGPLVFYPCVTGQVRKEATSVDDKSTEMWLGPTLFYNEIDFLL